MCRLATAVNKRRGLAFLFPLADTCTPAQIVTWLNWETTYVSNASILHRVDRLAGVRVGVEAQRGTGSEGARACARAGARTRPGGRSRLIPVQVFEMQ